MAGLRAEIAGHVVRSPNHDLHHHVELLDLVEGTLALAAHELVLGNQFVEVLRGRGFGHAFPRLFFEYLVGAVECVAFPALHDGVVEVVEVPAGLEHGFGEDLGPGDFDEALAFHELPPPEVHDFAADFHALGAVVEEAGRGIRVDFRGWKEQAPAQGQVHGFLVWHGTDLRAETVKKGAPFHLQAKSLLAS